MKNITKNTAKKKISKFAQNFYDLLEQEGYTLIQGEYINTNTEVTIQRNKCGHEPFKITPKYFRREHFDESKYGRCQQCRQELKDNRFKKELKEKTCGEFMLKGHYYGRHDKSYFIHSSCQRDFSVTPTMLFRYQRCEHCEYDKMIEEFKNHLKDRYGDQFKVLDTYKTGDKSVDIECTKCGTIAPRKIDGIKHRKLGCRGKGCAATKTAQEFQEELDNLYNSEYRVIKFYGTTHKTTVEHKCGYKREIMPQSITNQRINCPRCSNGMTFWTHDTYTEKIRDLGNDEYELLSEFKGTAKYIVMKHKTCGHVWDVIAASFLVGNRCPQCMNGKSHDSIKINSILSKTNLFYLKEYTMENCRNIRLLPFDFAIIKDKQLVLIEYDGEQHFESVEFWGGDEGLKITQQRDQLKNKYCVDNNIPLIRIPYWESEQLEHTIKSILHHFDLGEYSNADSNLIKKYLVDDNWKHEDYLKQHQLIHINAN